MKLYTLEVTNGWTFLGRVRSRLKLYKRILFQETDAGFILQDSLLKIPLDNHLAMRGCQHLDEGYLAVTREDGQRSFRFRPDMHDRHRAVKSSGDVLVLIQIRSASKTVRYVSFDGIGDGKRSPLVIEQDESGSDKSMIFHIRHLYGFNILGPDEKVIATFYCKNGKILSLSPWWKRIIMRWIGV